MITQRENLIQPKVYLFIEMERPHRISANYPGIMQLVDYDNPEAERQLQIWMSRHPHDFRVIGKNPLELKIYPTGYNDRELNAQKDAFVQNREEVWKMNSYS